MATTAFFRSPSLIILALTVACSDPKEEGPPPFTLSPTVAQATENPLPNDVESCRIYQNERCTAGTVQTCSVYDTNDADFTETIDPVFERVLLYDRWHDLYTSPRGLTAERVFTSVMAGDAPESEWGALENFDRYVGNGDSAIWTGTAIMSDIYRFLETGTEADYARMDARTRDLVRNFEVTQIPGYLARHHFLQVPPDAPKSDQLVLYHQDEATRVIDLPMEDLTVEGLPAAYTEGWTDALGNTLTSTAYWNGDPSIDQYTGPMTAFPIAYHLLRDEALKEKMVYHLTCYLKRLRRIEIRNIQKVPNLIDEVAALFGGLGNLKLDPTDPDLFTVKTLVWYVHPGVNTINVDSFDRSCPDRVQAEPWKVIDALDPTFQTQMLELSGDVSRDRNRFRSEEQIDHFYILGLRGGDAAHLMHLTAVAYHLTGEEHYKDFLFDVLIEQERAHEVAQTMMAFRLPDWCFRFYGDHITYPTHWQFITMLPEGEFKDDMIRIMEEEAWQKALYRHNDAKFNVMYAQSVPDTVATAKAEAVLQLQTQLRGFGGNDGVLDAPRRSYNRSSDFFVERMPADVEVRCPSDEERVACEQGGSIFGFQLEGEIITRECDGRAAECEFSDGTCVTGLASKGMPSSLRKYGDFMWQRSPFELEDAQNPNANRQSPGRDFTEPFWMARYYGFMTEGEGQVLAWKDTTQSCEE